MVVRESYIEQLKPFIDKPLIKILTGIRRSGKSTVLMMLRDVSVSRGVKPGQILSINFESFAYSHLTSAEELYRYIASFVRPGNRLPFIE
ncbi:MAG TPA: hypothetical protein DDZ96_15275 [Porphyromonadaceae bacterium]|jgi:hypothetical protein|uniref:AAA family ATPase n=1 Tax=Limibacterium fermenti TaxID=3229863 RepID=UPI000E949F40|nr:hypothetical protein [Porphyromonadaceae bacterium]HBL35153.1 hypothetical protein [Porphyromonadaceae bacterium]